MLVSDFNFHLPEDLIAQEPLPERSASRLLHLRRDTGTIADEAFSNFPEILRSDDLLLFNNTRVFPARLLGRKGTGTGKIEVLLTRQTDVEPNEWQCLVRPGKKVNVGDRVVFGVDGQLQAVVSGRGDLGERTIRFDPVADFFGMIEELGHVPLPPYISREDRAADRDRYQTVFARERGSIAAPTAGLHFTPEILGRIRERGMETAEITLHVGLGTFQPIRADRVEDHKIHTESYSISQEAAAAINRARHAGRRIVAIGTTTVRALEHASSLPGEIRSGPAEADIFIYPGYDFKLVGAMLTNFHLPQSTLLMLVCAFAGQPEVLRAYEHAVQQKYRFYSYGDCMFLE